MCVVTAKPMMLQVNGITHTQNVPQTHKTSSNSLSALAESAQHAKRSAVCMPPANTSQVPPAEPSKEKTLHAVDTEGIKAEGQAAAMAAIAAAQAQVNGHTSDTARIASGDYWVRSNSEEDLERADSGDLQVTAVARHLAHADSWPCQGLLQV